METREEWIPDEEFAAFVEKLPQVCVELFLEHDGGVLLARRTQEPAKGRWFWPGGRLRKGEELEEAARRVAREELGVEISIRDRLGVYSHTWETSSLPGSPSRHTVNVVFRVRPATDALDVDLDDQHADWRILRSPDPGLHDYVLTYLDDAGTFD